MIQAFTFQSGYIQIDLHAAPTHPVYLFYIPIWLYSNDYVKGQWIVYRYFYIPIWLYSNPVPAVLHHPFCYFYIPIWLYSNFVSGLLSLALYFFTFQSGYIQIWKDNAWPCAMFFYIPIWLYSNHNRAIPNLILGFFTFQSGYIQIHAQLFGHIHFYILHSNLVMFKSATTMTDSYLWWLYIPIWLCSNKVRMWH